MDYMRNIKPNDCTVCAVINALLAIGITVDREETEKVTKYTQSGGFADTGLKIITERLSLKGEYYPVSKDITWVKHPSKEKVTYAPPEIHKDKFFNEYFKRLRDGWVAVTSHRWEDTENFHAVALIGIEGEKIKVCCSLKGIYLIDKEWLVSSTNRLNGLMTTYWAKAV